MSTPNPLIPQGTFQAQAAKGASNVRLAVATIVAIHVVFFGGLLLQGCKRDPQTTTATLEETNASITTNLSLGPVESTNFYTQGTLPGESGLYTAATGQVGSAEQGALPGANLNQPTNAEALWQNNLGTPSPGTLNAGGETTAGATKEYTIAKGDTLGAIAKRNGVTLSALRKANAGVDPTKIRPGQKIQIPAAAESQAGASNGSTETMSVGTGKTYTVKSGDSLTKIAKIHGITVTQLKNANNLQTSRVNVGQKLKIPASTNTASAAPVSPAPQPEALRGF